MELGSARSWMRFTRKLLPVGNPPLGASKASELRLVASTNASRVKLPFITEGLWLTRTAVKFVVSVDTRLHARMFVPVDVQPDSLLGVRTVNAEAERARERAATAVKACIMA